MRDELSIPTEVPEDFAPTPPGGLTEEEAQARREQGLGNVSRADAGKSVGRILRNNLLTLFNLLNLALAACLVAVGSYRNMLFMGTVLSNALIGTVQELRARRTIHRLQVLSAPVCHVLRDGQERTCAAEDLVKGDLVVLRAGDQVSADAIVSSGQGAVNESLLTGESDAITKRPGDWLMSGSYLTEGRLVAQLQRVGDDSYANRLTRAARTIRQPRSALMSDLNKLLRLVSIILLPLGLMLFAKQLLIMKNPLEGAVTSTVAAMIGMIPEGLILLTSMALAVGVVKLGRQNTLVQELYGIETLARVDVLCLDKTGTLTTGEMTLQKMIPVEADEAALHAALSRFLGGFEMTSGTLRALSAKVAPGQERPVAVLPFSSRRKKSAASFADGTTLILGAPSFVLGEDYAGEVRRVAEEEAARGGRVLVLARARGCVSETDAPRPETLLGLLVLQDELRPSAEETLRYFDRQGVAVRIISGDHPRTVSAIARRVGLTGWDRWVDASTLRTEEELRDACERYTVFGRVTPGQKEQLVKALQQAGHSVAMTGDGVNDIPALKAADCSIAMAGGADAAKHAAHMTLLSGDFACLPLVVGEGRRVINNITRAASLFLIKTLYSFALSLMTLLLPMTYPFQPIQLTLVSTLTIGIPSFFLALEPNCERIRGSFLETVLTRAVPGAMAVTLCASLAMMASLLGWPAATCSTLATLSAGAVGLMALALVCWPLSRVRAAVLTGMTCAYVLAALFLGRVFYLIPLTGIQHLAFAALVMIGGGVTALFSRMLRRRVARLHEAQG